MKTSLGTRIRLATPMIEQSELWIIMDRMNALQESCDRMKASYEKLEEVVRGYIGATHNLAEEVKVKARKQGRKLNKGETANEKCIE